MNKCLVIILIFAFIALPCFASFTKEKMISLKEWFLSGGIKEEFKKEVLDLKTEFPLLIQEAWEGIKGFSEKEN